jgi:hypothetical protein
MPDSNIPPREPWFDRLPRAAKMYIERTEADVSSLRRQLAERAEDVSNTKINPHSESGYELGVNPHLVHIHDRDRLNLQLVDGVLTVITSTSDLEGELAVQPVSSNCVKIKIFREKS